MRRGRLQNWLATPRDWRLPGPSLPLGWWLLAVLLFVPAISHGYDSPWALWNPQPIGATELGQDLLFGAPRRPQATLSASAIGVSSAPQMETVIEPIAVARRSALRPVVYESALTQPPPAEAVPAPQPAATPAPAGAQGQQQTFGRAPTNDNLEFLRRQSVLLKEGQTQVDAGLVYTLFENSLALPITNGSGQVTSVAEARLRRRLLYIPAAIRYGLTPRIQLFGFMPIGYTNTQTSATSVDFSQASSNGGIGDITAGGTFLLCEGCGGYSPTVVSNVGFTAPSGHFGSPLFGLVPGSGLGLGFWAVAADFLCINQYDPIVVYYGAGYRHLFARDFNDVNYQPGEQFSYQTGVGFSVNDRVTLSTSFQGYYITSTYLNDQRLKGSNLEPLSLRFACTISRKHRIIEPFALIGMTINAPAAQVGTIITFR